MSAPWKSMVMYHSIPKRFMALLMRVMSTTPTSVCLKPPEPPAMLVPPTTMLAMMLMNILSPSEGIPASLRAVAMTLATPA